MRAICCPSIVLLCLLGAASAWAHVGSPDVYVRGDAGPYTLYVSVHPPAMLPGAAEMYALSTAAQLLPWMCCLRMAA